MLSPLKKGWGGRGNIEKELVTERQGKNGAGGKKRRKEFHRRDHTDALGLQ